MYREARAEWADRILLQAVALVPIDAFQTPYGEELATSSPPQAVFSAP